MRRERARCPVHAVTLIRRHRVSPLQVDKCVRHDDERPIAEMYKPRLTLWLMKPDWAGGARFDPANDISHTATGRKTAQVVVTEYLSVDVGGIAYDVTGEGPLVVLSHGVAGSNKVAPSRAECTATAR